MAIWTASPRPLRSISAIASASRSRPGHVAGQHVDVRLTAEDGYQAQRSYSIASAPEDEHLVLTVERLDDGEVSPYLTETLRGAPGAAALVESHRPCPSGSWRSPSSPWSPGP